MKKVKVKVRELSGVELDYAVALCEGATAEWRSDGPFLWDFYPAIRDRGHDVSYKPSHYWGDGGPIIEREDIDIGQNLASSNITNNYNFVARKSRAVKHPNKNSSWYAPAHGPTRLIAAMRCYVASKFGETIEIPEELYGK